MVSKLLRLTVLLAAAALQFPVSSAEDSCEEGSMICHRDCCQRHVQYCNEPERRCTNCKDREPLCGTKDEPLGCALHCYFLRTTTTSATSKTPEVTSTARSLPDADPIAPSKAGLIVIYIFLGVLMMVSLALLAWVILLKRTTKHLSNENISLTGKLILERRENVGQLERGLQDPGDMPVHGFRTEGESLPLLFQDISTFEDSSRSTLTNERSTSGHVTTEEGPAQETDRDGGAPAPGLHHPVPGTNARSGQARMGVAGSDGPRRSSGSDESSAQQAGTSMQSSGRLSRAPHRGSGLQSNVNGNASTVVPENDSESTLNVNNHSLGFDVSSGGDGAASSSTDSSPSSSPSPLATSLKVREDEPNGRTTPPYNNIIATSDGNNQPVIVATGTHNPAAYAHITPYPAKV